MESSKNLFMFYHHHNKSQIIQTAMGLPDLSIQRIVTQFTILLLCLAFFMFKAEMRVKKNDTSSQISDAIVP